MLLQLVSLTTTFDLLSTEAYHELKQKVDNTANFKPIIC